MSSVRQRAHPVRGRHALRALAQRIAVVRALVDDVDRLPGDEPDVERQQRRRRGLRRIDVPGQPMRIAQAVGPDLLARAVDRRERIVVGDAIAAVLADGARVRVLAQVGDDAEDLADEGVESLRVQAAAVALLAGLRVAGPQIHHPPVRIARSRDRVEGHLAQRMRRQRILHAQELAGRAFERGVRDVAIRPFDEHDLAIDLPVDRRRLHRRRRRVAGQIESRHDPAARRRRRRCRRIFHVQRVEHAVARVVGIENDVGESGREVAREGELREQARTVRRDR